LSPAASPAQASARITLALSLAGFSCFMLLYGTQPLLPQLTGAFGISPGTASLSVTAGTGLMALLLIPLSLLADRYGRERLMRLGLSAPPASRWLPPGRRISRCWCWPAPDSGSASPACRRRPWPISARNCRPPSAPGRWACTSAPMRWAAWPAG
jgi:hypothetical protein